MQYERMIVFHFKEHMIPTRRWAEGLAILYFQFEKMQNKLTWYDDNSLEWIYKGLRSIGG